MKTPILRWSVCALLLVVVTLSVHFLCLHYGSYLQSENIDSTHGIARFGLYLLYPGFLPAMFVWPGAHQPSWWAWVEGYNIVFYSLVFLLVCRKLRGAKAAEDQAASR